MLNSYEGPPIVTRFPACILATCCVPWDADGRFLAAPFEEQVRRLARLTPQLYVFGTAGEGYAVDDESFLAVVESFRRTATEVAVEPMVGVISLSLPTIVRRIDEARRLGIRRFQISLPSWGPLNDAEVDAFFAHTCGRFADCEFLHYNLLRTKRLLTPEDYARLADRHPNLTATKNSTDSIGRIAGLLRTAPQLRHFFTETGFGYAARIGECGLLASVSTTNHGRCRAYFEAGLRRDADALAAFDEELAAVTQAVVESVGPGPHMDGAYDKLIYGLHDPTFPLRLLPPYQGADEAARQRLSEALRRRAPRWLPDAAAD